MSAVAGQGHEIELPYQHYTRKNTSKEDFHASSSNFVSIEVTHTKSLRQSLS